MQDVVGQVVVVGDEEVGKTALVARYIQQNDKMAETKPTIGINFKHKGQVTEYDHAESEIKLHIWDCSGDKRFDFLAQAYYQKAQVFLLCFDINKPETLENLKPRIDQIRSKNPLAPLYLAATKTDEIADAAAPAPVITDRMVSEFCCENEIPYASNYFKTSAKSDPIAKINKLFSCIAAEGIQQVKARKTSIFEYDADFMLADDTVDVAEDDSNYNPFLKLGIQRGIAHSSIARFVLGAAIGSTVGAGLGYVGYSALAAKGFTALTLALSFEIAIPVCALLFALHFAYSAYRAKVENVKNALTSVIVGEELPEAVTAAKNILGEEHYNISCDAPKSYFMGMCPISHLAGTMYPSVAEGVYEHFQAKQQATAAKARTA